MPTKETSQVLPKKVDLEYTVREGFNQIEPKTSIRRLDTSIGRTYYNPDDKDRKCIYSSTTILNVLSKGVFFSSWLKAHGNDCDRLMNEAATKGTIIHVCCSIIAGGEDLRTDTKLYDKGNTYEITEAIYHNILAFKKFYNEHRRDCISINEIVDKEFQKEFTDMVKTSVERIKLDVKLAELKSYKR